MTRTPAEDIAEHEAQKAFRRTFSQKGVSAALKRFFKTHRQVYNNTLRERQHRPRNSDRSVFKTLKVNEVKLE